ncbi:MAG: V-type ATP synthase subunit F [Clostridiaceae bacterium]|nr:V-type ATP synthase subunit F [Clostridiaceae bacterium]
MYQVAVIGDRDSVIGFRALGMTVLETDDPADAANKIHQLVEQRYVVIFLTEKLAECNQEYLQLLRSQSLPAIIPIPSITGSTGLGMRQVRESVKRAVGMDLFAEDPGGDLKQNE